MYWSYHKQIAADDTFDVQVLPAWRPDKAMNIEKPDYFDYLPSHTCVMLSNLRLSAISAGLMWQW